MMGRTRQNAFVAGLAGASLFMWLAGQAAADITVEPLGSTLTQSVGGNSGAGYFHGPSGAFTTFSGSEQWITPWISPAIPQPANPTDLIGNYTTVITGMPIPAGTFSTPIAEAGADVSTIANAWGYDISGTVQSRAEADFDFAGGDATLAEADLHVRSEITYSVRLTFPTAYHLHAEGGFTAFTQEFDGNAAATIASPSGVATGSLHMEILDGGLTTYDFTSADSVFSISDQWLGAGAQVTISFTAVTEAGFVTTASRVDLGSDLETVSVLRQGYSAPFLAITPEPASLGLLALGMCGLLLRRRK